MDGLDSKLTGIASQVADYLCGTAIWDGDACTWLTYEPPMAARRPRLVAAGISLYDGCSGIALFLSEFFRVSPSPLVLRTLLGALRFVARNTGAAITEKTAYGFFAGLTGAALAIERVCSAFDFSEFKNLPQQLLNRLNELQASEAPVDLVSGQSGLLLVACSPIVDKTLRERARQSAHRILGLGLRGENAGLSWSTEVASGSYLGKRPLTGLAHGAAGIGLALLEFGTIEGEAEWVHAGLDAFEYEDSLYSEKASNWPDLRTIELDAVQIRDRMFTVAWCHGAPGILLSRARALGLGAPISRITLPQGAIETTLSIAADLVSGDGSDHTLCHGTTGLLEVLKCLSEDGFGGDGINDSVLSIWSMAIERRPNVADWVQAPNEHSPGLMLGLAGIGYAALRATTKTAAQPVLIWKIRAGCKA